MKGLKAEDLQKLAPYLNDVVAIDVKILKRGGKQLFVADINQPNFRFIEDNKLRSIERSVARGPFGKWNYPGNCGYALPKKFINYVKNKLGKDEILLVDPMEGSGTVKELSQTMEGVNYWGSDLRYGFDYTNIELPVQPDSIWIHPPYYVGKNKYGKLSRMPRYSGVVWGNKPHESDGSHLHNYKDYIKWLNKIQAISIKNLRKGGYLGILVGSSRVDGTLYDPYKDMDIYGELEAIVCKEQFNCMSDSIKYPTQKFVPIIHEWLLIIRKKDNFIIPVKVTREFEVDLMKSTKSTWKELVVNAVEYLGGLATLDQLYDFFKDHPKTQNNNNWKAKIRQICGVFTSIFERVDKGVYALRESYEVDTNNVTIATA